MSRKLISLMFAICMLSSLCACDNTQSSRQENNVFSENIASKTLKAGDLNGRISVGFSHAAIIDASGTLKGYGWAEKGREEASEWKDIVQVSAGFDHTVGLKSDGTVVAAGRNYTGACDVSSWSNIVAVDAGMGVTVGLTKDGKIISTSYREDTQQSFLNNDYVKISCDVFLLALRENGTVEGFEGTDTWRDIIDISVGEDHGLGLKSDGTVVAIGSNRHGQCNVDSWKDIVAISAGSNFSVGLKSDGTVVYAGATEYSDAVAMSNELKSWKNIVAIDSGGHMVIGINSNGETLIASEDYQGLIESLNIFD